MHLIKFDQFINLENYGKFEFYFSTPKNISKKSLNKFFKDIVGIIGKLDPNANFVSEKYSEPMGVKGFFLSPFYVSYMVQAVQLIGESTRDVKRTTTITYNKEPIKFPQNYIDKLENNQFKDFLPLSSNLRVESTKPVYDSKNFIENMIQLNYIQSIDHKVFDASGIINQVKLLDKGIFPS